MDIYRKSAVCQSRDTRFARACAVEVHMDISEEPCCAEIYRGNAARLAHGQRFVRACAIEMDMDSSQEPFFNAGRPGYHLD